jgi:acetyl esterase/lipase
VKNPLLLLILFTGLVGLLASACGAARLPPDARIDRDLAYGTDPQQRLDVYIPAHAKGAPIILMVHGGAWTVGDKAASGFVFDKVTRYLPRGYVIVSSNYRMSRQPNPLDQADDIARALAFVQAKASSWGGDPGRVLLLGHSAGAHLVSLLAADPRIVTRRSGAPWLGTIALDSAAFDIVEIMRRKHYAFYDRVFGQERALWIEASPFHRLTTAPAPMLVVCSTLRNDACPQARAFAAKAAGLGGNVTVLPVDLTHAQINKGLGQPSRYTVAVEDFMHSLGLP